MPRDPNKPVQTAAAWARAHGVEIGFKSLNRIEKAEVRAILKTLKRGERLKAIGCKADVRLAAIAARRAKIDRAEAYTRKQIAVRDAVLAAETTLAKFQAEMQARQDLVNNKPAATPVAAPETPATPTV